MSATTSAPFADPEGHASELPVVSPVGAPVANAASDTAAAPVATAPSAPAAETQTARPEAAKPLPRREPRDVGTSRSRRPDAVPAVMSLPPLESGFPWERSPLAGISSTKILAELQRRRERSAQLLAERDRILELMDAIEERLTMIGHDGAKFATTERPRPAPTGRRGQPGKAGKPGQLGKPGKADKSGKPGRRGQPGQRKTSKARNTVSLREAIALAVEPRALVTPAEAAELLKRNGYRSTAANFATLVGNALARDERFRRLGRGSYERIG